MMTSNAKMSSSSSQTKNMNLCSHVISNIMVHIKFPKSYHTVDMCIYMLILFYYSNLVSNLPHMFSIYRFFITISCVKVRVMDSSSIIHSFAVQGSCPGKEHPYLQQKTKKKEKKGKEKEELYWAKPI